MRKIILNIGTNDKEEFDRFCTSGFLQVKNDGEMAGVPGITFSPSWYGYWNRSYGGFHQLRLFATKVSVIDDMIRLGFDLDPNPKVNKSDVGFKCYFYSARFEKTKSKRRLA